MFNDLIRYWNQNREKLIKIIIAIIAIIALIQVTNQITKKQSEEKRQNAQNTQSSTSSNTGNQSSDKSANKIHTDSIITDTTISYQTASKNQIKIQNFIQFCNNGDIDSAYSMLSQNCKNELFDTSEKFKTKYIDKIFTTKKQYNIENWISGSLGYTYKVTYINDNMLETGTISKSIKEYITIDKNEELNILRYISNVKIEKIASNGVATINVIDKDIYDDYEIYNIKVTNNSENTIMLNRKEDNDKIYVTYSGSNTKYTAFISEIYEGNLTLDRNQTKYISIKINKTYDGNMGLKKIVFADIINNKTKFDETKNKNEYTDISIIQINM